MTKVKGSKKYVYSYPENEVLAKHLHYLDLTKLSQFTGYTRSHLTAIFKGRRRMPDIVLKELLKLCPEAEKHSTNVPIISINRKRRLR